MGGLNRGSNQRLLQCPCNSASSSLSFSETQERLGNFPASFVPDTENWKDYFQLPTCFTYILSFHFHCNWIEFVKNHYSRWGKRKWHSQGLYWVGKWTLMTQFWKTREMQLQPHSRKAYIDDETFSYRTLLAPPSQSQVIFYSQTLLKDL